MPRPTRVEVGLLVAILCLATALRIAGIGTESLSMDEGFSLRDAAHWPPRGMNALRPFYYGLLSLWTQFGSSDAWLRGLGAIFGLACVVLTWRLGRRTLGVAEGLVGAMLMAVSVAEISHSQEIRMYTMAAALGLLGCLATSNLARRPSLAGAAIWAGFRISAALTATFTALLTLADAVLLFRTRGTRLLGLVLGSALGGVGLVLTIFPQPLRAAIPWWRALEPPGWMAAPQLLVTLVGGWPLRSDRGFGAFGSPILVILFVALAVVAAALAVLGAAAALRSSGRWVVAWFLAVPLPLGWLSHTSIPIWTSRYLYFASPYLLLLVAAGLVTLARRRPAMVVLASLVLVAANGVGLARYYEGRERTDFRGMARYIAENMAPGDLVAVTDPGARSALTHYLPAGTKVAVLFVPIVPEPDEASVLQALDALAREPRPIWLVHWHFLSSGPRETTISDAIARTFTVCSRRSFLGGDVVLVTSRAPDAAP